MTRLTATPAELMAVGRLQSVCLAVLQLARTLVPLADRVDPADEAWRVDALAALRALKVQADQREALTGLPGRVESQRAAIVAALEGIGATVAVAEIALRTGNAAGFTLLAKYRLSRGLGELDGAIQALTRATLARQVSGASGFAC